MSVNANLSNVIRGCSFDKHYEIYYDTESGIFFSHDVTQDVAPDSNTVIPVAVVTEKSVVGLLTIKRFFKTFDNSLTTMLDIDEVLNKSHQETAALYAVAVALDSYLSLSEMELWVCKPLHAGYPPAWNDTVRWAYIDPNTQKLEFREI